MTLVFIVESVRAGQLFTRYYGMNFENIIVFSKKNSKKLKLGSVHVFVSDAHQGCIYLFEEKKIVNYYYNFK